MTFFFIKFNSSSFTYITNPLVNKHIIPDKYFNAIKYGIYATKIKNDNSIATFFLISTFFVINAPINENIRPKNIDPKNDNKNCIIPLPIKRPRSPP